MLRPNFEDSLDTAQDLVDNNITLFVKRGEEYLKQILAQSSIPEYKILAETMATPRSIVTFKEFMSLLKENGTVAYLGGLNSGGLNVNIF